MERKPARALLAHQERRQHEHAHGADREVEGRRVDAALPGEVSDREGSMHHARAVRGEAHRERSGRGAELEEARERRARGAEAEREDGRSDPREGAQRVETRQRSGRPQELAEGRAARKEMCQER